MPRNIEFKVGLFVIIVLLLISAFVAYMAFKKDVFSKVYTFTFSSKSGESFSEGMPLVFSGFQIGKVHSLELNEEGLVIITIKVPERHVKWMRSDSIFILDRPLIGKPKIVVYTESLESPVLTPQTVPEVFPVDSIDEAIQKTQPLLKKVETILENSEKITATLAGKQTLLEMALGDKKTVSSINQAFVRLNDISRTLDHLLTRVDAVAAKTDDRFFGKEGILPLVRVILNDVTEKLERLNSAIDDVPKISSDVVKSTANLDKLKEDIDTALDATNALLKDIDTLLPGEKESEIALP